MLKDASYDAVFAAVDFYANLFLVFILGKFNGISLDKAIFQFDAVADLIKLLFCNFLVKEDVIDFLFEEFGMGELSCQITVIGEQEYTSSISV